MDMKSLMAGLRGKARGAMRSGMVRQNVKKFGSSPLNPAAQAVKLGTKIGKAASKGASVVGEKMVRTVMPNLAKRVDAAEGAVKSREAAATRPYLPKAADKAPTMRELVKTPVNEARPQLKAVPLIPSPRAAVTAAAAKPVALPVQAAPQAKARAIPLPKGMPASVRPMNKPVRG